MVKSYIEMDINDYDETEVKSSSYIFTALCTSDQCVGTTSDKNRIGAVKAVSKACVFCPDCEFALFWEKLPK